MEFDDIEWDENKRNANIDKHKLDFRDAVGILDGPCSVALARKIGGEPRWIAIGMLDDIHVAIIYTMRERVLRVISMRKARKNERENHHTNFGRRAAQGGPQQKLD